jgi:glycosyltransferase involved in cell wall biosynthesis
VKVAFLSSAFGTPRHRCQHPCEQLRARGIEAAVLQGEAPSFSGYTHAVLNRVPLSPALAESIAAAERAGTRVLFDVDDLIFDRAVVAGMAFVTARPAPERQRLLDAVDGIARTIERCGAGLCATPALRRELESRGRSARVALNGVSDEMVRRSDQARAQRSGDARVRIGFPGGHPGHEFNLAVAEDALAALLQRYAHVAVTIIGSIELPPRLRPWADRVELVPYVDWRRLPLELARLDVCIAPLADNTFNHCKSDIKFLEAALVRVPVVASPVGQLGESIRHGVTGLLADGTAAWTAALSSLVEQEHLRASLAEAACEQVLRERTSAALGPALVEALLRGAAYHPRTSP